MPYNLQLYFRLIWIDPKSGENQSAVVSEPGQSENDGEIVHTGRQIHRDCQTPEIMGTY